MKRAVTAKVLVLGEDSRSCLAVVRSLGRMGVPIALGFEADKRNEGAASHSRYVTELIRMPSTRIEVDAWLAELQRFLERQHIDLVIPCSDSAVIPLVRERPRFQRLSKLAIPDSVGYEHTFFKDKTLEMARELSVPVPNTILLTNSDSLYHFGPEQLRFPLIVKPVSSKVWKDGRRFDLKVAQVRDYSGLMRVAEVLLEIEPVLIQEHFDGVGVGQEFLLHEGSILSAFQHERVHEPLSGGGSSYRKSVPLDEEMLECSRKMLARLRWEGVAMVEYRKNPETGEFTLMEINGRFWGSLPLAVASGINFPYQLYRLMVYGEAPLSASYRVGLFGRNFRKDVGWFKERITNAGPRFGFLSLVRESAVGLQRTFLGNERVDEITLDDPVPGFVEILRAFRSVGGRIGGCVRRARFSVLASSQRWRQRQRTRLRRLMNIEPKLLFVCRGNICRSPFAERYAKLRLAAVGLAHVETLSAGTHPVAKRLPPQVARNVSLEFGVELGEHRSRVLEPKLTEWAGAIVCMDLRDYRELRNVSPRIKGKLFLLKAFDVRARGWEIPDPWGKSANDFRSGYIGISSSVEGLIQGLIH